MIGVGTRSCPPRGVAVGADKLSHSSQQQAAMGAEMSQVPAGGSNTAHGFAGVAGAGDRHHCHSLPFLPFEPQSPLLSIPVSPPNPLDTGGASLCLLERSTVCQACHAPSAKMC